MSGFPEDADITYAPHLTPHDVVQKAQAIAANGIIFVNVRPGRWLPTGLGMAGGLIEPFQDGEIVGKVRECSQVAYLPNVDEKHVVIVKGYDTLREERGVQEG